MSKQGEKNYPLLIGPEALAAVSRKPFSSHDCADNLVRIGIVLGLLPPPPGRLLDLGCGTGWTSLFFARRGYDVTGVDIAPAMIDVAEELRRQHDEDNLRFLEADYEELAFDRDFDAAVFFDSLHHAVDEEQALRAAYRALRPGGVCVTTEPGEGHGAKDYSLRAVAAYDVTEKDMPPHHIVTLARQIGFRGAQVYPNLDNNLMVPYAREAAEEFRRPEQDPCRDGGVFKRLFHRMVRWRMGLEPATYAGLITSLPALTALLQSRSLGRHGVVVLEK